MYMYLLSIIRVPMGSGTPLAIPEPNGAKYSGQNKV